MMLKWEIIMLYELKCMNVAIASNKNGCIYYELLVTLHRPVHHYCHILVHMKFTMTQYPTKRSHLRYKLDHKRHATIIEM